MGCRIVLYLIFALGVFHLTSGKPFLNNAPSALASLVSSASATASGPPEPPTHIADLRTKQQKAEKLQAEKQLADEEVNNPLTPEEEDEEKNEAAPSLLQKKLNKVLAKIRFISSFASISGSNNDNKNENEKENNKTTTVEDVASQEVDRDVENDVLGEESTERANTLQKIIYPDSKYGVPIKLRLNLSEKQTVASDGGDEVEVMMGRLSQIGVFFAELLGSVVGLVYGAAAQLNNIAHGPPAASNS